ncbi:DUF202 domain-containing protein [Epidermidibacterium keratini]|uniref:DUF202 domain-containing protein n=1 Tax=Epidermidibacterium keratini TaxID=1891644 RepID=A0A7L4YPR5_9ACTN|nr:DUF202 domain-containing protein [Epidermidibacterium keratini]QHC00789.1 DUF202 domain-containing protein [Epidermidibacterium keratini]
MSTATEAPEDDPQRGRLASRVLGGGREPDPRFSLANERTFLAWIRTSLALLAGGVGLEAFAPAVFPAGVRKWLAIALIALAMALAATSCFRWVRLERAMRQSKPLPLNGLSLVLAAGTAIIALVIGIVFLTRGI